MATLDSFLPLVRGRIPGCPEMILENAVRDACIEFCKRTQLLTERVDVDVEAGEPLVTLFPGSDLHWDVLDLRRANTRLTPLNRQEVIVQDLGLETGQPQYYYLEGDRSLVLLPIPETAETLTALVTLRPTDAAQRVPDVLYSDYREPIAAGARAWVRRNHGEWSELRLEGQDRQLFENAIHNQNIRRARGGAGVALRVRSHSF